MRRKNTKHEQIEKFVLVSILAALLVVLQLFVSIPGPGFTITFSLIPIVVGAILCGPTAGGVLGMVFGIVVAIQVPLGLAGPLSLDMYMHRPFLTIVLCILKGVAAGLASGFLYCAMRKVKNNTFRVMLSAIACPVVNTFIFVLGFSTLYFPILKAYAGEESPFVFIIIALVGLNFIIEFLVNVILSPVVVKIINLRKKQK